MAQGLVAVAGLAAWMFLVAWPVLAVTALLVGHGTISERTSAPQMLHTLMARSISLAISVAFVAVVLGYVASQLLANACRDRAWLLWLMLVPVLWPQYVTCHAWSQLLSHTAPVGRFMASQFANDNQLVAAAVACFVQVLYCWPLAALIIAGGRHRGTEASGGQAAGLQGRSSTLAALYHPLGRSLAVAFVACLVVTLSQYDAFSVAGVSTYGTELVAIYQGVGATELVVWAAGPLVAVAVVAAIMLRRHMHLIAALADTERPVLPVPGIQRTIVATALILTMAIPVILLFLGVGNGNRPVNCPDSECAGLLNTCAAAGVAACLAVSMAAAAVVLERCGRTATGVSHLMQITLIAAALVPGPLIGMAHLAMLPAPWMGWILDRWPAAALGQAARFAGIAVLLFLVFRAQCDRRRQATSEAESVGSTDSSVHCIWQPDTWRTAACVLLLVAVLSFVELPATMFLRPPGVPYFTPWLFDRIRHHADGLASMSCLLLLIAILPISGLVVLLWRRTGSRPSHRLSDAMTVAANRADRTDATGPLP